MFLLCLADLHGELDLVNRYHADVTARFGLDIEAALVAGDVGFYRDVGQFGAYVWGDKRFPLPVVTIFGNHEDLEVVRRIAAGVITVPNLHLVGSNGIEHAYAHCDGYDKGDHVVQIMGVGGAYNAPNSDTRGTIPFDESVPKQHLAWWRTYRDSFPVAERGAPASWGVASPVMDILLAHECPTGFGAIGDPRYGGDIFACGSDAMGDLWRAVQPKIAISGHYHRVHDYRDPDGLRWVILPEAKEGAAILDTDTWQLTMIGPPRD